MATTTPNYGWTVPTSTDLVKDGATAIETLGDAVDATVFANANAAIAKTIVDAKGDIIAATAADTVARLPVGTNGQALKANSATATGLEWGSVAATKTYSLLGTGTLTSGSTVTVSGISGIDSIFILIQGAFLTATNTFISMVINGDTATNYEEAGAYFIGLNSYSPSLANGTGGASPYISIGRTSLTSGVGGAVYGAVSIFGGATAGKKVFQVATGVSNNGVNGQGQMYQGGGVWNNTATITSISLQTGGTFSNGTFKVYGAA